jgi:PhnB protein
MANAIPDGLHSLTPQLSVEGADKAIDFYKRAFGATEHGRANDPSGTKVWHSQLRIGNSAFFVNDTMPGMAAATQTSLWIYTQDVDGLFNRAVDAGAKVAMPVSDMFWGDRTGTVTDAWGNRWTIAQHMKDLTPEQMKKAQDDFVAQMQKKKK